MLNKLTLNNAATLLPYPTIFIINLLVSTTLPHIVIAGVSDVLIASLDCNAADNVNKELCLQLGVNGVPSIIIVKVSSDWSITSLLTSDWSHDLTTDSHFFNNNT